MSTGVAALLGLGGGSMVGAIIAFFVTRHLARRRGGTMPKPPPLALGEERVILSPGWNGPEMETSANYRGRGSRAYLRTPERRDQEGRTS